MLILQYAPGLWNGGKLWRSAPQHSVECGEHSGVVPTASAQAEGTGHHYWCVLTVSNTPLRGLGQTPPQEKAGHADMPCPFGNSGPCSEAGTMVREDLPREVGESIS